MLWSMEREEQISRKVVQKLLKIPLSADGEINSAK